MSTGSASSASPTTKHVGELEADERQSADEMDERRREQIAYEYLCHLEEARFNLFCLNMCQKCDLRALEKVQNLKFPIYAAYKVNIPLVLLPISSKKSENFCGIGLVFLLVRIFGHLKYAFPPSAVLDPSTSPTSGNEVIPGNKHEEENEDEDFNEVDFVENNETADVQIHIVSDEMVMNYLVLQSTN